MSTPATPSTPPLQAGHPQPVQWISLKKEDFEHEPGIAFINQQIQQIVDAINGNNGVAGTVVLPHGVDVRGASVTGLAAPSHPSDAVSAGHADANYGGASVSRQLDLGGKNTLKGLASVYQFQTQNASAITSIPATAYAGGESFTLFGMVLKRGHTGTFTGTQPVTFGHAFPTACVGAWAVDDYASAAQRQMSVNQATVTASGFTIVSSGSGNGAYWLAIGY